MGERSGIPTFTRLSWLGGSRWAWCDKWRQRGGWEYSFNFFSSWSSEVKWCARPCKTAVALNYRVDARFCKVRRRKWTRTVCLEIADTVAVAPESANTLCISGPAQPDKQEAPPPVKVFVSPWKGHSQGQRSANSTSNRILASVWFESC